MLVHEIINYHAHHLLPVLSKQGEAAIREDFATFLLQKKESTRLELSIAVATEVNENI